jgi:hypothetical protein
LHDGPAGQPLAGINFGLGQEAAIGVGRSLHLAAHDHDPATAARAVSTACRRKADPGAAGGVHERRTGRHVDALPDRLEVDADGVSLHERTRSP